MNMTSHSSGSTLQAAAVWALGAVLVCFSARTLQAAKPSPEPGKLMMTARWTDKAPSINGVLSPGEWSAALPVHVNFVKDTPPGVTVLDGAIPSNPNDLSFTIYTMYDATKLYVAVWVADDILVATPPGPWEGDAVELFIDGDRVNGCPPPDDPWAELFGLYEVWTDCQPQQGVNDWIDWNQWDEFVASGFTDDSWRVCGKEGFQLVTGSDGFAWNWTSPEALSLVWETGAGLHSRGYVVEWSVALDSIDTVDGPADQPPQPGDIIGFDIAVDENDGLGWETQGWWDARKTGYSYMHEDEWGLLYFEPPTKK